MMSQGSADAEEEILKMVFRASLQSEIFHPQLSVLLADCSLLPASGCERSKQRMMRLPLLRQDDFFLLLIGASLWCPAIFTPPDWYSLPLSSLPPSSSFGIYITLHLPFSLSARDCFPERLPSMLRLMFLFLSRLRSSWKSSVTLWLVLADVSMKAHFHWLAWASPSLVSTSRWVSSLLFPTSMMGMDSTLPFIARICNRQQKQEEKLLILSNEALV